MNRSAVALSTTFTWLSCSAGEEKRETSREHGATYITKNFDASTYRVGKGDAVALVGLGDELRVERGGDELRGARDLVDHGRDGGAVHLVEVGVNLVEDVKRRGVAALDRKDQRQRLTRTARPTPQNPSRAGCCEQEQKKQNEKTAAADARRGSFGRR